MVTLKTDNEIELIRQSNLLVSKTHAEVAKWIKPGVKTITLDKIAEEFIRDNGGIPGFLDYNGYPNTLCISPNSIVVHGIPTSDELKEGDIVSIDCGVVLNDYYGDSAYTFPVGDVSEDVIQLMKVTKESLYKGIGNAIAGKRLGDIGSAIQTYVQSFGYSVVREMVGHGVGRDLHEEPKVANYGKRGRGMKLLKGLVIAIEPMINMGKRQIRQDNDGWTIRAKDGKPSAHFEHTIAITENGPDILSTFEYIEEVLKYNH